MHSTLCRAGALHCKAVHSEYKHSIHKQLSPPPPAAMSKGKTGVLNHLMQAQLSSSSSSQSHSAVKRDVLLPPSNLHCIHRLPASIRWSLSPTQSQGRQARDTPLHAGNSHALAALLPRWLDSLSWTRDGDLTRHAVVVTLGAVAQEICWQHPHKHHCVSSATWPGPEEQYHFGSQW